MRTYNITKNLNTNAGRNKYSIPIGTTRNIRGSANRIFQYCKQNSDDPFYCMFGVGKPSPPIKTCLNGFVSYSYTYTGSGSINEAVVLQNLPVYSIAAVLNVNPQITIVGNTVYVEIITCLNDLPSYPDDVGISLNSKPDLVNFINTNTNGITFIASSNCPFAKNGSQFKGVNNLTIAQAKGVREVTFFKPYFLPGTSLSGCFQNCSNFNSNISGWDTTNVVNMSSMFNNATAFNINVSSWNTSNVTNMTSMFEKSNTFNQNVSSWDTSKVTDMSRTFREARSFNNGELGYVDLTYNLSGTIYTNSTRILFCPNGSFLTDLSSGNILNIKTSSSIIYVSSIENILTDNSLTLLTPYGNNDISTNIISIVKQLPGTSPLTWNTSSVTNMSNMFEKANSFNQNISEWNISNVTATVSMFEEAFVFNQPIGSWDTGNITNMQAMFATLYIFNQPIGSWNTSNVTNMRDVFYTSRSFNQPINSWDTSYVTNMRGMFGSNYPSVSTFNQDIGKWITNNVTDMSVMFLNASVFNQNIGKWNVSNVTTMANMFNSAFMFNNGGSDSIKNWYAPKCTSFEAMFRATNATTSAHRFNQPLPIIVDTSGVSSCSLAAMFQNDTSFNQNVGGWNVINVTNMGTMFFNASMFNNDASNSIQSWKAPKCVNFANMFAGTTRFNQPLPHLVDTSGVTNVTMNSMFQNDMSFNQNVGAWNVSNVVTMANMFQSATQFNNGGSNTIQTWYAPKCREFNSMFQSASRFNQPLSILVDTSGVTNVTMNSMFLNDTSFNQNVGAWNVSNVVTMANMFDNAFMFNNGGSDSIKNWYAPKCTSFEAMFRATSPVATLAHRFNQPLSILVDTSGVSSCSLAAMFQNDTSFNQNIGGWNVINVVTMANMFQSATQFNNGGSNTIQTWYAPKCREFNSMFQSASRFNQPLSILVDTSGVIDCSLNSMFQSASVFNQPLNFNTINVTTMASMFQSASVFNQPLNFNTINVTTMASMFQSASAFNQSLNTNGNIWNVSKVKTMKSMFSHSSSNTSFKGTLNNWDTSSVTTMEDMFYLSDGFNQNISHFNLSNVTNLSRMMSGSTNKAFNNGDESGGSSIPLTIWTAPLCTNFTQMFANCSNFNQDISNLVNTSTTSIVSMQGMLQQCSKFNKNVGNWDVSNVIRMDGLFRTCLQFNNDGSDSIKNWKTGKVTNMTAMFSSASVFNQPIGLWDVGNVTLMYDTGLGSGMLQQATEFNQNLSNWNVSKVTTFRNMFRGSTSAPTKFNNGQTSGTVGTNPLLWDTSACTNMQSMFQYCTAFNQNITTNGNIWNVSKVTTVINMFEGISSTNKNKFNNGEAPGGITSPMGWTRTPTPTVTTFRTNSELTSTNMPQGWGIV